MLSQAEIVLGSLALLAVYAGFILFTQLFWSRKGSASRAILIECLSTKQLAEETKKLEPLKAQLSKVQGDYQVLALQHKALVSYLEQSQKPLASQGERLSRLAHQLVESKDVLQKLEADYENKIGEARNKAARFSEQVVTEASSPLVVITGKDAGYFVEWGAISGIVALIGFLAISGVLDGKRVETLLTLLLGYIFGRRGIVPSLKEPKE